ncbi:MAG: HAD-IIIA family hydrolase [Candidatus Kapaibacterium sp.]|nr:HAD-IIIA family hydrolase [Ignavibacteriota bacterium]MCB9220235.1 HAD-IIIA family hydrolase [Ignavibacteria bacterium]
MEHVKLIIFDVDGTMTDGGMYYSSEGEVMKRFQVKDGMGIVLLKKAGFKIAIMTSEDSPIAASRAKKLGADSVILGCHNKSDAVKLIAKEMEFEMKEIAFMGDDVNDYHAMNLVGFSACPSDAVDAIKKISDYVCQSSAGHGAVREFAEVLLRTHEKTNILNENW